MDRDGAALRALLAPVPGTLPAGPDLRDTAVHDRIREARRGDDPRLPQGVWQRERKRADWPEVARLCSAALAGQSKDLLLAAWLAEAWVQIDGFAGLPRGLRLLAGLCRDFWPDLHPAADGADLTARLAPLEWFADRLPPLLQQPPLLRPAGEPDVVLCWADHLAAQRLETVRQRDAKACERAEAAGAVGLARVLQCRERTDTRVLTVTDQALRQSRAALDELSDLLGQLCGREAPSFAAARSVLEDILAFLAVELTRRRAPKSLGGLLLRPDRGAAPPGPAAERSRPAPPALPDCVASREELCQRIADAAAQLRLLAPHSPAPYLIELALEWDQMPLPEFLAHVAAADGGLAALFALLGLPEREGNVAQPVAADAV